MSLFPVNSAREAFGYFRPLILVNAEPHPRGIPEGAARAVRNFEGRTVRRPAPRPQGGKGVFKIRDSIDQDGRFPVQVIGQQDHRTSLGQANAGNPGVECVDLPNQLAAQFSGVIVPRPRCPSPAGKGSPVKGTSEMTIRWDPRCIKPALLRSGTKTARWSLFLAVD